MGSKFPDSKDAAYKKCDIAQQEICLANCTSSFTIENSICLGVMQINARISRKLPHIQTPLIIENATKAKIIYIDKFSQRGLLHGLMKDLLYTSKFSSQGL